MQAFVEDLRCSARIGNGRLDGESMVATFGPPVHNLDRVLGPCMKNIGMKN